MAPPLPPPGVPARAGWRRADRLLWVKTLLSTVHDTPMLLSAPPLEHALPARRPAERAVDDVHGLALRLAEHPDGGAADVGPGVVAAVAEEPRVDDLEPAAADEDGAAAAALGRLAGGVAVDEGQVLDGELRVVLVLAVRGGPDLGLVAGVHVEDAALAAAAERDLAAAVEHDLGPGCR